MRILPDIEGNPETFDLTFNVTDEDGPVEGANVSIDGKSGTTGVAGGCTAKGVTGGLQSLTVTKTGYEDYTDSINVTESTTIDVTLTKQ